MTDVTDVTDETDVRYRCRTGLVPEAAGGLSSNFDAGNRAQVGSRPLLCQDDLALADELAMLTPLEVFVEILQSVVALAMSPALVPVPRVCRVVGICVYTCSSQHLSLQPSGADLRGSFPPFWQTRAVTWLRGVRDSAGTAPHACSQQPAAAAPSLLVYPYTRHRLEAAGRLRYKTITA